MNECYNIKKKKSKQKDFIDIDDELEESVIEQVICDECLRSHLYMTNPILIRTSHVYTKKKKNPLLSSSI